MIEDMPDVSCPRLRILHNSLCGLADPFQSFNWHSRQQYRTTPHPAHFIVLGLEHSFQSHLAWTSSLDPSITEEMSPFFIYLLTKIML